MMAARNGPLLLDHRAQERTSADVTITRRRKNVCCTRICHLFLVIPFIIVIGLTTLSFANLYTQRNDPKVGDGGCPLYAVYDTGKLHPGKHSKPLCMVSIWGEVAVAGICLGAVFWLVLKTTVGISILSISTIVEVMLLFLLFIAAACISTNTTIGLYETCNIPSDGYPSKEERCKVLLSSYDLLKQSKISSLVASGVLLVVVLIWLFLASMACCAACINEKRNHSRNRGHATGERTPLINQRERLNHNGGERVAQGQGSRTYGAGERPPQTVWPPPSYQGVCHDSDSDDSSSLSSRTSFN